MYLYSYNYERWLERWIEMGVSCIPACEAIDKERYLILRHDVDFMFDAENISLMASLEERNSIRSSYYLIVADNYYYYNDYKSFFLELQDRGHEIGLHVNAMEISNKPWKSRSKEEAIIQLKEDMNTLINDGFNLRTMCAHGSPFKYNNKDLLSDVGKPMDFAALFSLDGCVLSDSRSRGNGLAISRNIFGDLPGKHYSITHPHLFEWVHEEFVSIAKEIRYIEDIERSELNRIA